MKCGDSAKFQRSLRKTQESLQVQLELNRDSINNYHKDDKVPFDYLHLVAILTRQAQVENEMMPVHMAISHIVKFHTIKFQR